MLENIKQFLNGDSEIPLQYIYYLIGLNIVTIFVFLYAVYYIQKIMNQDDDDDE
uniref:Photosystem II protein M n=1 Tax=Panagrolaimus sp. ES5 TaxID=591445 RepID=A0AC34GCI7_9BILA